MQWYNMSTYSTPYSISYSNVRTSIIICFSIYICILLICVLSYFLLWNVILFQQYLADCTLAPPNETMDGIYQRRIIILADRYIRPKFSPRPTEIWKLQAPIQVWLCWWLFWWPFLDVGDRIKLLMTSFCMLVSVASDKSFIMYRTCFVEQNDLKRHQHLKFVTDTFCLQHPSRTLIKHFHSYMMVHRDKSYPNCNTPTLAYIFLAKIKSDRPVFLTIDKKSPS